MNGIINYLRNNTGATAIEFALVAVPFFLIMLGVFETGRIMWTMNTIQYAVEDTGRYVAVNEGLTESDIITYAEDRLRDMSVPPTDLSVTSNTYTEYGVDWVEIDVSYELTPLLGTFIPFGTELFQFESSIKKPLQY
ncbi:MAG: pilus assembly protein [Rhodospirillales bacterium]|nr:pilus assembly protein [Rhodospirillales bacterium]MCB9965651.1 pilus assembly protein [Rhodospirillales bacterium]MCB9973075.1 pilus assembly protein [Rhodospirillales bacterium]